MLAPMAEYVVELFVARGDVEMAVTGRERARAAALEITRRGSQVAFRRSILLAAEETCFLLFDADSLETVQLLAELAELGEHHIAAVSGMT